MSPEVSPPFCAARRAVSFHNGAIDQIQTVARFRRQLLEDTLPDASARPTVEAIISRRVGAVACRQIPPWHSGPQHVKYRIHNLAIVNARALSALRQQWLKKRPVLIAQIKSNDPPPRTVNHVRSNYSIIYLGTDPRIFPIMHLIAIRKTLVYEHPWLPVSVHKA